MPALRAVCSLAVVIAILVLPAVIWGLVNSASLRLRIFEIIS